MEVTEAINPHPANAMTPSEQSVCLNTMQLKIFCKLEFVCDFRVLYNIYLPFHPETTRSTTLPPNKRRKVAGERYSEARGKIQRVNLNLV